MNAVPGNSIPSFHINVVPQFHYTCLCYSIEIPSFCRVIYVEMGHVIYMYCREKVELWYSIHVLLCSEVPLLPSATKHKYWIFTALTSSTLVSTSATPYIRVHSQSEMLQLVPATCGTLNKVIKKVMSLMQLMQPTNRLLK